MCIYIYFFFPKIYISFSLYVYICLFFPKLFLLFFVLKINHKYNSWIIVVWHPGFIANLTQQGYLEKRVLTVGLPGSDWPVTVSVSVGNCLDWC